jgi:hypothetical protein
VAAVAVSAADMVERTLSRFTHVEASARKVDRETNRGAKRREEQRVTIEHEVVQKTVLPRLPRSAGQRSRLWKEAASQSGAGEVTRAGQAAQVGDAGARRVRSGKTFSCNSPALAECRFLFGSN